MAETKTQLEKIPSATGCQCVPVGAISSARLERCKVAPRVSGMLTYFIQHGDGGPIKIGKASDLAKRLNGMQCGTPVTLTCVGFIEGDWEADIHDLFAKHRIRGEWFAPVPALLDFIRRYAEPSDMRRPEPTPARKEAMRKIRKLRWMHGQFYKPTETPPWRVR